MSDRKRTLTLTFHELCVLKQACTLYRDDLDRRPDDRTVASEVAWQAERAIRRHEREYGA